jgi:glutamate racemase
MRVFDRKNFMDNRPIGIFDSGVGGLTVVKEIFRVLPNESIVYLGDTARVPYGTKSRETIKRFSAENAEFLMRLDVKIIIVACNTASSISIPLLKKIFRIPVLGVIRPGAGKAVRATKNSRIGVIATSATVRANAYEKEIKKISKSTKVFSLSCPLFVPLAEEGWLDNDITYGVAKKYLSPLVKNRVDTLILGCTHYPLLKKAIAGVMGSKVRIIDSAGSVAEDARRILEAGNALRSASGKPAHKFFATDAVEQFVKVGEKFLGTKITGARRAGNV